MDGRFQMTPDSAFTTTTTVAGAEKVTAFLRKVYGWMFFGLGVTASVAIGTASSPTLIRTIFGNPILLILLVVAQLGLVFFLSARVQKLAPGPAAALFLVYSGLTGLTLSSIFLAYTGGSIASTFIVAAGMFGALALFGSTTKRSLAGIGQFVFMGLIGLVLAMVVGMLFRSVGGSAGFNFVISIIGVIVFTGLTAWDAQRLKQMALSLPDGRTESYAVVGALSLYLDFLNLFLFLLRFMGSRRD
jgi:FtsH-binding integral membrane protein